MNIREYLFPKRGSLARYAVVSFSLVLLMLVCLDGIAKWLCLTKLKTLFWIWIFFSALLVFSINSCEACWNYIKGPKPDKPPPDRKEKEPVAAPAAPAAPQANPEPEPVPVARDVCLVCGVDHGPNMNHTGQPARVNCNRRRGR